MSQLRCPLCDTPVNASVEPRSLPQLRRYMSLCQAAFEHWPEAKRGSGYPPQFDNWTHLRLWLQMSAGYRQIAQRVPISLPAAHHEAALNIVRAAVNSKKDFSWPVAHRGDLVLWRPVSIAFANLAHSDACQLMWKVERLIEDIVGVPGDQLLDRWGWETGKNLQKKPSD